MRNEVYALVAFELDSCRKEREHDLLLLRLDRSVIEQTLAAMQAARALRSSSVRALNTITMHPPVTRVVRASKSVQRALAQSGDGHMPKLVSDELRDQFTSLGPMPDDPLWHVSPGVAFLRSDYDESVGVTKSSLQALLCHVVPDQEIAQIAMELADNDGAAALLGMMEHGRSIHGEAPEPMPALPDEVVGRLLAHESSAIRQRAIALLRPLTKRPDDAPRRRP